MTIFFNTEKSLIAMDEATLKIEIEYGELIASDSRNDHVVLLNPTPCVGQKYARIWCWDVLQKIADLLGDGAKMIDVTDIYFGMAKEGEEEE